MTVGFRQGHPPTQPFELWTVGADGSGATKLVHYTPLAADVRNPTWSPRSGTIAFEAFIDHLRRYDMFTIRRGGGSPKAVMHSKRGEWNLDWGKTGRIAFSLANSICTIAPNGRGLRNLTRHK